MAILQADNLLDLVATTQKNLGRGKWTDIISSLQRYVAFGELMNKEKVGFSSGTALQWNVQVTGVTGAEMTGLFQVEKTDVEDTMSSATAPWRYVRTSWAVEDREVIMNSQSPERIVDLIRSRKSAKMVNLADLLETQYWSQPVDSDDKKNIFGVPYWIVPDRDEGFNGLNPYGFTAGAGGLSSVTYPNWANYTASYTDISKTDLVRAMRRAAEFTDFESPPSANVPSYNTGNRYGYYTTYLVRSRLEEIAETQNDNLGNDVASKDGKVLFLRNPIVRVPKFEGLMATTNFVDATYATSGGYPRDPVYMINWGVFKTVFLKGEYLKEIGPTRMDQQPRTMRTSMYMACNNICYDRRRCAVITK